MLGFRFSEGKLILNMETYRRRSKGWEKDAPAYIHPRILFGSGMALQPEFVKKHTITHVINCAFDEDSPVWFREKYPNRYVCLEAIDDINENILKWYPKFEKNMQSFLKDPQSQTIYIHCQCGINRSGFLALLYACKKLHFNYNEVVKSILSQRPCALTNLSFANQVKLECSK